MLLSNVLRVDWSIWPWKSVSPTIEMGLIELPPLSISVSTRPSLCWGSGMPRMYAMVGARSMVRAVTLPLAMPGPPATNVARMLMLPARFWTSGT